MVDPSKLFQHGRVPCKKCGQMNDFGSSEALYYASLATPCVHCGFRFLEHMDRQMQKMMEMADKDPQWREVVAEWSERSHQTAPGRTGAAV